jgi:rubrerythrin
MARLSKPVKELIKEAIKLEINGKAFFNHAAELTENELGKKMFHRLFSSIMKTDEWKKELEQEELKGTSDVIEGLSSRMKRAEGKSEIEALRIGMELEQKAIDFFKSCCEGTDDPVSREIFEKIADEERFHYDLLQAQYDSLTHSGFWLDSAEFKMDSKF